MFVIFKNGRPQGNKKFTSYEKARQQARKWIRKNNSLGIWYNFGISNPATNLDGGYTIRKISG